MLIFTIFHNWYTDSNPISIVILCVFQRIVKLTKPTENWIPASEKYPEENMANGDLEMPKKPTFDNPTYNVDMNSSGDASQL